MRTRIPSALPGFWGTWGALTLLVIAGFVVAFGYVGAPPPKVVRLAAGSPDGAYYRYGQRYAEILAKDGITLEVVATAGSVENLARLSSGDVALALVQGGCASDADRARLQSLGSFFAEPVWVFTRTAMPVGQLSELKSKRIAVGSPGSGTAVLSRQLLAVNGVTALNATLVQTDPAETARALLEEAVDAAMFVAAPDAPFVRHLAEAPGIALLDLGRTAAYARRYAYLTPAVLSQGVIDLERDIPPRDTRLVATAANLVARTDLNVSLIPALLNAVTRVHQAAGLLESQREFPSADLVDLPVNEDAARYIRNGPSFLYRWLPYTTAVLLDRLKVLALPFVALVLPLLKVGPPLYQWRIRSRIYRWYADVRAIDARLLTDPAPDQESLLARLQSLEQEVASVSVPLAYAGELYHLRLHIRLLQERLNARARHASSPPTAASARGWDEPGVYGVRDGP